MAPVTHLNVGALAAHVDRQLLVPVLQHLRRQPALPAKDVLAQLLAVVAGTARADLAAEVAADLKKTGGKPAALTDVQEHGKKVEAAIANVDPLVKRILETFENADAEQVRPNDRNHNAAFVREQCDATTEQIDMVYEYGQWHYELGRFEDAANILDTYRRMSTTPTLYLAALWGKLACHILLDDRAEAYEALDRLKDAIEAASLPSPSHALQHRVWLLHWSLYVYFYVEGGVDRFLDLALDPSYLNAVETAAPHLLRYLVAATVLSDRANREVARYAAQERYRNPDPLCVAYENLYLTIDLDVASAALKDIEALLPLDYFLAPHADAILAGLRKHMLKVVSNVYTQLPLAKLAALLHVDAATYDFAATLPDAKTMTLEDDVVSFSQDAEKRRSVLAKLDKLSHRSDNTMAALYKQKS